MADVPTATDATTTICVWEQCRPICVWEPGIPICEWEPDTSICAWRPDNPTGVWGKHMPTGVWGPKYADVITAGLPKSAVEGLHSFAPSVLCAYHQQLDNVNHWMQPKNDHILLV